MANIAAAVTPAPTTNPAPISAAGASPPVATDTPATKQWR
jgi:hypothetical protein